MSEQKTRTVGNKTYSYSDEIKKVAEQVIKDKKIDLGVAKVAFLMVYPNITKTIVGLAKRTTADLKFFADCDYVILMSGETWDMLDETTRYILTYHELLHLDPTYDPRKGEWKFKIRPHSFEDFFEVIDEYGLEWFKITRSTAASLYDMSPDKEEQVSV